MFTPNQIALLGFYYFDEEQDEFDIYSKIADAVFTFISLGDPYTSESILLFAQGILKEKPKGALSDEANFKVFVSKCQYWGERVPE